MFDEEFFPTPNKVIRKMIEPHLKEIQGLKILEPSAGKGNILDYIMENHTSHYGRSMVQNLFVVEQNLELQMILTEKKYRLVASDFFKYNPSIYFDLILMNPPFSNGVTHLLHAYNILKNGHIVCLLNEQTILNPNTKERKLLKAIIEKEGSVEFLGDCFSSSERKTNVKVAMVRIEKKEIISEFDIEFDLNDKEKSYNLNFDDQNELAHTDIVKNFVAEYEHLKRLQVEMIKTVRKMKSRQVFNPSKLSDILKNHIGRIGDDAASLPNVYSDMVLEINEVAWDAVFQQVDGFSELMTESVRKKIASFKKVKGGMEFTEANIKEMLFQLLSSKTQIVNDCVLGVFDMLTKYDKRNKVHVEGWKTNDAWKVNRKIIAPYVNGKYGHNYHSLEELDDIDKAMCHLSGKNYKTINTIKEICKKIWSYNQYDCGKKYESEFFELVGYKKGTLHLTFKDPSLLEKFNVFVAKQRNWLPDDYKYYEKTKRGLVVI